MTHVLLLTGRPGVGKTTVIRKVAAGLAGWRLGGFYTEEIRVAGERRGFSLTAFDGRQGVMAHVDFRGRDRVGRYGVDVAVIDELAASTLALSRDASVYLVDEIGIGVVTRESLFTLRQTVRSTVDEFVRDCRAAAA